MKRLLILLIISVTFGFAQTTLSVSGPSADWVAATVSPTPEITNLLSDSIGDRQTGQTPDDFVGPGAFINFGTVNGVDSVGFRFYMAGYSVAGYSGNLRVGLDLTQDGAADIFFGPSLSGAAKNQGISFQMPTGPGNYSPDTTALGNSFNTIPFTIENYSYQLASSVDSSWSNQGAASNASISFAIPAQTLKTVLESYGIIMTDQTYFSFLAFTSTQGNAINQDLYGSTGITATTRFDGPSGGFTDYYALDGSFMKRPIVPEPSTYGAIFILLSITTVAYMRARKRA